MLNLIRNTQGVCARFGCQMQACSGATVMGSLQQPIWTKGLNFPPKGSSFIGSQLQVKLNSVKLCRSSYAEASMVTGRPPSSVSVPVPESEGTVLCN